MNRIILFLTITILLASYAAAQSSPDGASEEISVSFRPSVAIVIGIFAIMFTLTFVLLIYTKFCSSSSSSRGSTLYVREPDHHFPNTILSGGRFSGVDKSTIESLPFFRFSTLKGSREGLECAVCLSKFEDNEILRLLPKCKHAFHIGCVDQWLENHSSCPMCRCRVEAQDLTVFKCSNSSRFLFRDPSERDDPELELFVEREVEIDGNRNHGSTRFSIGGSFRKVAEWSRSVVAPKEESLLPEIAGERGYSKLKHKIVVSDVVFKNRWSDLNASDLTWLHSDMLSDLSSRRFSTVSDPTVEKIPSKSTDGIARIREEMERKRALESKIGGGILPCKASSSVDPVGPTASITVGRRSVSEIANVPRFVDRPRDGTVAEGGGDHGKDEKVRRVWLPIARRTVQWLAGRERRPTSRRNIATEV